MKLSLRFKWSGSEGTCIAGIGNILSASAQKLKRNPAYCRTVQGQQRVNLSLN
jgi:hypothetical protein